MVYSCIIRQIDIGIVLQEFKHLIFPVCQFIRGDILSFYFQWAAFVLYTQEDGKRIYNLYLRAIARIEVGEGEELPKGQQLNLVNAFSVEEFYNMVSALEEEKGSNTFSIAINYASAFNKDTTACIWDRTEPIEYKINSRTE